MTNVQARKGWRGWGELAPKYDICSDCQPEVTYSMTQTGGATTFKLGGTKPYSDVLWSYPMVGPASVLDLPDNNKTLVPSLKNFIYDAYFFSSTIGAARSWSLTSVNTSAGKVLSMGPSAGSPADMHGTSGTT